MAAPIRPDLFPPLQPRPAQASSPAALAAQRAFFQAALQQAGAARPVAPTPAVRAPAQTPAASQASAPAQAAEGPLPRLGLHLDIRV